MVDSLNGLRHHTIVSCDHKDCDVGKLGTAGTHSGERLMARGIKEGDFARFALKIHRDLVCTDTLGDAAGLTCDDVGLADGIQQSGLTMIDMAHDGDDRRTRFQILIILQLFLVKVDVELLQQLLVFLLGGNELDVPADFLTQDLEGLFVQGLGGGSHLAQVEEHGDQCGLVDVNLLRQISQGSTLTQADGLAVAVGDANAADGRCFQLLILMTLCQTVLTGLRGLAALTAESTSSTAATTAATAACGTIARGSAALEVVAAALAATESTASAAALCGTALTRTVMTPLAGTRTALTALARTTTAESTTALTLTLAWTTGTAATTTFSGRTSHRMRARNIARSRRVHALLTGERVIARTRTLRMRARNRVGSVASSSRTRTALATTVVLVLTGLATVRTPLALTITVRTALTLTARTTAVIVLIIMTCGSRSRRTFRLRARARSCCSRCGTLMCCSGSRLVLCRLGRRLLRRSRGLGIALIVLVERGLQTTCHRRFNRRGSGLNEFTHVLELLKNGLAIDVQVLSQFVYAWFRH